jgi:hypothetical protein
MTVITQEVPQGNRHPQKDHQSPAIVAEWPIKRGEVVRVSIEQYKSSWLFNVRKWFEADDGEMRPGKGLALSVKHLPRLAEATAKALEIARARGLLGDEQ